eukprot:1981102-Amphidinium_carterae.1
MAASFDLTPSPRCLRQLVVNIAAPPKHACELHGSLQHGTFTTKAGQQCSKNVSDSIVNLCKL